MKVVFFGNCQAGALRMLFSRYVQPHTGDEAAAITSYTNLSEADHANLASADVIAMQTQDFNAKAGPVELPAGVPVHRFPVVGASFLWPFSGRDRTGNVTDPNLPSGPYPAQLGDSYLNRLLRDGIDLAEAERHYIELDVAKVTDLDRLFNIALTKQRRMDESLGYDLATLISDHFRTERLFTTAYHPEARLMKHIASILFAAMGVPAAIIRRMQERQMDAMLPISECPIHPSVARHYGLRYIEDDTKYRFHGEGAYSFAEWVRRYLAGTWNPALADGIRRTLDRRPPAPTLALLEDALRASPGSAPGWTAVSVNLRRLGRLPEAVDAARKAADLDPVNPRIQANLGMTLLRANRVKDAADALLTSYRLDPAATGIHRQLIQTLQQSGDINRALAVALTEVEDPIEPPNGAQLAQLARLLETTGDRPEALRRAEQAVERSPGHPAARLTLADILTGLGRHAEALEHLRALLALRPNIAAAWFSLARATLANGNEQEALDAARKAVELDPGRWNHQAFLARAAELHGLLEEAEQAAAEAAKLRPEDKRLANHHARLLRSRARKVPNPSAVKPAA